MTTDSSSTAPPGDVASQQVRIFDTTLRDGEQAPGFSMNRQAKLRMAQMLESLGVDVMETGFPAASPDDFAAVAEISRQLRSTTACALARCQAADIEAAGRALEGAHRSRIHVFLSTSPLHREFKLGKSKSEVIDLACSGIERALQYCDEVEFSAEDALRTEPDYLIEVFNAAIAAGASTLNAPDTVGFTTPTEVEALFRQLYREVRHQGRAVFSAHCHDDLGMAVANSLAAVAGGARQIECTINGIGERAGNASLEEVVMALKVRSPLYGLQTRIDTRKLYPASRLLSQLTGQSVPRNKAIVGENAFAHESGIHQHGMLKHRGTYEIMTPQDVGIAETRLVLGKHSGRAALRQRLQVLGQQPDEAAMEDIFIRFKALADRKSEVHDDDLIALALGQDPDAVGPWHLGRLSTHSDLGGRARATIGLRHDDGRQISGDAQGDGPVDAALKAIADAIGLSPQLTEFQIRAVGAGSDAQGQAHLSVSHQGRSWRASGVSTDVIEAAAQALLSAINRIQRSTPDQADAAARRAAP